LHAALNHLPIIGLAVASLVLLAAVALRNRVAALLGLALVAVLAALVWPVIQSGESAYNRIRAISDPDSVSLLKQHMLLADRWAWLYYLTALAAVAGAVVVWKRPEKLRLAGIAAAALAFASLMVGMAIGKLGGQVRHPEFRPGSTLVPPDILGKHDHEHEHNH